jgi:hypothetical protein
LKRLTRALESKTKETERYRDADRVAMRRKKRSRRKEDGEG